MSLKKKIVMESPPAKRKKLSEHEINEPTQISFGTKNTEGPDTSNPVYDAHYESPFYVDKTLLVRKLIKHKHILITAPSRFGKSLNMDMAKRFYEIELDHEGKPIKLDVDENKLLLHIHLMIK
ncbi:hypothetical protein PV327_000514 [Microctonus hyperodae]|uniref:AAA-ATPase-like domain-containing protein n=1 Tax=Microctonus hyperodae TaxID=165561 RepID=A0AA39L289_MICHY|nr:hypothetical protein PV327_000514 [Microctonus hyperodae]